MPGINAFTVTFMVRDPVGLNHTLVDAKKHGFGGLMIQDLGDGNYSSSYSWDPPDTVPLGDFDLYFKVVDPLSASAEDVFDANQDELTLIKAPTPPTMTAGVTTADPAEVNVLGNETTSITTSFFHEDIPAIDTFKVSFKIRDVGNQEYPLLNSATKGTPGLTITGDGAGNFNASYVWDPPSVNQPLGTYDLFASIVDLNGLKVEDGFNNNLDELTLIKKTVAPGNATVTGKVTDVDGIAISGATVKIYNSSSGEVVETLTTDADGTFSFEGPAGMYDVAVQATGYKGESKNNNLVKADDTVDVGTFSLIKLQGEEPPPPVIKEKEVIPMFMYGVVAFMAIIVILLIVLLGMKMTKGTTEPGGHVEKAPPGHHAHERKEGGVSPDHPIEPKETKEIEDEPKPIDPHKVEIEKIKEED
jgi:hypothetical protein